MALGDLDRQLARLDPIPSDELRACPRPLLRDVDADEDLALGRAGVEAWLQGLLSAAVWGTVLASISWAVWRRGRLRYTGVGM